MTTPDYTIVVRHPDGRELDITEGVQALYDHMTSSLDWSSGFYAVEDVLPVQQLAHAVGFEASDEVDAYVERHREIERAYAERQAIDEARRAKEEAWLSEILEVTTAHPVKLADGTRVGANVTIVVPRREVNRLDRAGGLVRPNPSSRGDKP